MSFKQTWDVATIMSQIQTMTRECNNAHNTGFITFEIKKDLWQIKFLIDDAINRSPMHQGEEEWLGEQEKKRVIKHLKN